MTSGQCSCDLWHCTMEDKAGMDAVNEALWAVVEAARPFREKAAPREFLFDGQDFREWQRLEGAFESLGELVPEVLSPSHAPDGE